MKEKERGICYAHPVEWITPLEETIVGSVMINARLAIGKIYASKRMHYSLGKIPSVMNIQGLTLLKILNMILRFIWR